MCKECFSATFTGWKVKYCDKCNQTFGNQQCFLAHIQMPEKARPFVKKSVLVKNVAKLCFHGKRLQKSKVAGRKSAQLAGTRFQWREKNIDVS